MAKDPVCGMNVDEQKAAVVIRDGKPYYFCSLGCKATFEKDPAGAAEGRRRARQN